MLNLLSLSFDRNVFLIKPILLLILDLIVSKRFSITNFFHQLIETYDLHIPSVNIGLNIHEISETVLLGALSIIVIFAVVGVFGYTGGVLLSFFFTVQLFTALHLHLKTCFILSRLLSPWASPAAGSLADIGGRSALRLLVLDNVSMIRAFLIIYVLASCIIFRCSFQDTPNTMRKLAKTLLVFNMTVALIFVAFLELGLRPMFQSTKGLSVPYVHQCHLVDHYKYLFGVENEETRFLRHYSKSVCADPHNSALSLEHGYQSFLQHPYLSWLKNPSYSWLFSFACNASLNYGPLASVVYFSLSFGPLYICTELLNSLKSTIEFERELFRDLQFFDYVSHHWERLQIPKMFCLFCLLKISLVVSLGPAFWPLVPIHSTFYPNLLVKSMFQSSSDLLNSSKHLNMIIDYASEDVKPVISMYECGKILLNRSIVYVFVHGTETWLSILASTSLYVLILSNVTRFFMFLIDPFKEFMPTLERVLDDPPVDIDVWNAIEDPDAGNDRINLIAAELVSSNFYCVLPLMLLVIQYDLPNLCLAERIYAFIHALVVVNITCFYSFEAFLKAYLINLRSPGNGSTWFAHIRPLVMCCGILYFTSNFVATLPDWIFSSVPFVNQVPQNVSYIDKSIVDSVITSKRTVFLTTSIMVRKLKLYLCCTQLVVGVMSTFVDYLLHQYKLRRPDWDQFNRYLWWTRFCAALIEYVISLISFFIVLWLTIFDSFGVIRSVILLGYVYFILYPIAAKGYLWIRMKLLFAIRVNSMRSPTVEELARDGDRCVICFSEMTPDDSKVTRCGHYYHLECLSLWMMKQAFCPTCHADLLSLSVKNMRVNPASNSIKNTPSDNGTTNMHINDRANSSEASDIPVSSLQSAINSELQQSDTTE